MANRIVAQMLFLEAEDPEKGIYLYINSPGSTSFLQGKELVGATLTNFDERGRSLKLKIKDVQPDYQDKDQESYLYTVIYYSATDNIWYHLRQNDLTDIKLYLKY